MALLLVGGKGVDKLGFEFIDHLLVLLHYFLYLLVLSLPSGNTIGILIRGFTTPNNAAFILLLLLTDPTIRA